MNVRTSLERWLDLWKRLGLAGDGVAWYQRLMAMYSEPHRAYHTLQHLEECLNEFDAAKAADKIPRPDVVEVALWFHDAVYNPRGSENEEMSATMAAEALAGHDREFEVARLISLTKSHEPDEWAGDHDYWIIDIDLTIFGQPIQRVLEYERQIRMEYAWVPDALYREKRREILTAFLNRRHIYLTDWFHTRYDKTARENLTLLIHSLWF